MTQEAHQQQLWGSGPRRLYWWHLPVRPDKTASLGRDMIVALFVWVVAILALVTLIDVFLVAG